MMQPKLRFSEFEGDWKSFSLIDLSEKVNLKNKSNEFNFVLTNSAEKGIVAQRDFFDHDIANQNNLSGYYIVDKDDFVYNPRISNFAPVGPIKRNKLTTGVMSPLYFVFRFKSGDLDFYEYYFETDLWHNYLKSIANSGARHDRMNLSNRDLMNLPLTIPSLPEQQKIASFLSTVDEKINLLKKQLTLLEQYKKGVMQKIFSREICFKDDDGKEFPEWEEKRLGEICKITTGKLDANSMIENGKYRFYTCAKNYFKIDRFAFDTEALLISGNGANVGYIHYYKGKFNAYQRTYVLDRFREDIQYIKFYLQKYLSLRINNEKKEGNTPYIVLSTLSHMMLGIPSIIEQQKIASFLSSIDEKIDYNKNQIRKMESWKKGLLQQMFI